MASRVCGVGLNLRLSALSEALDSRPDVAFWEVIAENLFDDPVALARCETLRSDYPISLHCVGMNLAGVDALDAAYLDTIADLRHRLDPFLVSDHLCWQQHDGIRHHDLLPFPMTTASTRRVINRVGAVQERLGCRIAVENLSAYVEYQSSTKAEVDVLNDLASSSGCGLLLDLNNLEVNERNLGISKDDALARVEPRHVVEIHVAGGECVDGLWVDTHGAVPTAFQREALHRSSFADLPICYERDRNVPALAESVAVVRELEQRRWGLAS